MTMQPRRAALALLSAAAVLGGAGAISTLSAIGAGALGHAHPAPGHANTPQYANSWSMPATHSGHVAPAANSWSVRPAANSWSMRPVANSWSVRPAANSWSMTPAANSWSVVTDRWA